MQIIIIVVIIIIIIIACIGFVHWFLFQLKDARAVDLLACASDGLLVCAFVGLLDEGAIDLFVVHVNAIINCIGSVHWFSKDAQLLLCWFVWCVLLVFCSSSILLVCLYQS